MYEFDVIRPATISEAVEALADEDAQALGGGQTLIPTLKARLASPSALVSLSKVAEMIGICYDDQGRLCIGAATTHAAVARDTSYPALSAMAAHIGDPAVRNRGTIGGSLANNDPAACYPAGVLASNATITTNKREIAADDFFQGLFETALEEGEIVTEVKFTIPQAANYQKFIQPASRFALVGVFVAKFADGVRVAVTGASEEGVHRWTAAEEALSSEFTPEAIADLTVLSDTLISDAHAIADYRSHLVKVMTGRAVKAAG
ncbi:MAG: xanthine dehydrogenase family protein subunit M [Litoreibacter sp.]|nr:xanthine dehydrogenase family protein subunit M [Litoreibacter sp.]MCY4335569.1 xanthine dehydrogenase family protein subunit M [Litoreibacter sp.]